MQAEGGTVDALNGGNRRGKAVGLGDTLRLPWRGVLSVGAQSVWSSGSNEPGSGPALREPDQSRTPYVQYHQDLRSPSLRSRCCRSALAREPASAPMKR